MRLETWVATAWSIAPVSSRAAAEMALRTGDSEGHVNAPSPADSYKYKYE